MPRSRVLSFMSQWGAPRSPTSDAPPSSGRPTPSPSGETAPSAWRPPNIDTTTPQSSTLRLDSPAQPSPSSPSTPSRARGDSKPPRPNSMLQAYNPPQMDVEKNTPAELQPIFSFLNSHSNKLYQEGYFLKLHDLDARGRPSSARVWAECFAQLIGTVLSLWDAAALDVAGADGEVVPTFINLSDASIKMIESLPMNGAQGGSLQNVLSISTAANNRYLLHFNSLGSLTQWTAGIRLAMFEHSTLQEAYTGSLIAGKGRYLNSIKQIMFKTQFAHEDWARVRFGAGTPWRRCWCVVSPPDEKEMKSAQKVLKKGSSYEKPKLPQGNIKFYDTKKVTKKTRPIATVSDAYAAYAIYPQSKPLIDQSTLVKLEGQVVNHSVSESSTEGFVFIMPEVHAAVSGFEILLRFLFPVFDVFNLYGRPNKLIADTLDQRGLMFALPKDRRYGYLDILDVSSLIHAKGSQGWSERQWRREMKKLTADRMMTQMDDPTNNRQTSQRRNTTNRVSMPPGGNVVRFGNSNEDLVRSTPGSRSASPGPVPGVENRLPRTDSAPPSSSPFSSPHKRSVSEAMGYRKYQTDTPSRLSYETGRPDGEELPPAPPQHGSAFGAVAVSRSRPNGLERINSATEVPPYSDMQNPTTSPLLEPPQPVVSPPAFTHQPNSRPVNTPYQAPELRRAHSNVDAATLYQMQAANRSEDRTPEDEKTWVADVQQRQQNMVASQSYTARNLGVPADRSQGVVNSDQRDPRQRLSTIPGSPYIVDDVEAFQSPQQTTLPQLDGVLEEPPAPHYQAPPIPESRPPPPVPLHSSQSITRKPVPRPLPSVPPPMQRSSSDPGSPTSATHEEDWEGGVFDEEALDRVLTASDRKITMKSTTTASSEPDYASTAGSSVKGKVSIEKPRTGKLKTVGDPNFPTVEPQFASAEQLNTWNTYQKAQENDIPSVNFGPTYALKPDVDSRPGTSHTLTPTDKRRSRSVDGLLANNRLSGAFGQSPKPSPNEANRLSYFRAEQNTPSPGRSTPEYAHHMENRQNVWQPGAVASPGSPARHNRNSVSPEQWVAQRATMAQQPQYAAPKAVPNMEHGRSNSVQVPPRRKLTKTPPIGRTLSGDWTQQVRQQTPPNRPSSRGAGINLDAAGGSLSATQQMQVSRSTGTPLVNLTNTANKSQAVQSGLIGYVGARERDRIASKEGRNSMAVQQAIERQQQQTRMEADTQAQARAQMHAQAQAQAQAQAEQQYQMQMQQHMDWTQQMLNQNQAQTQFAGYYQPQRPTMQNQNSWPQQQQQQPPAYYGASPHNQNGASPGYNGQYTPNQQRAMQQQYGAGYCQQQQVGQGQQYGRR